MAGRPLVNDLRNQRYGFLVVEERAPSRNKHVYWRCRCDCGNYTEAQTFDLIVGSVQSCGCYRRQRSSDRRKKDKAKL